MTPEGICRTIVSGNCKTRRFGGNQERRRGRLTDPQEEKYAGHDGKLKKDDKPSVKGRIKGLLKGKGKDDLNEREWRYSPN